MSDTNPKWRRFEDLVAHIQRTLAPAAIVEQNVKIPGVASGVLRQVDILIRTTVGQFDLLVVVDCKDHKEKIDVKGVEEFIGFVSDVVAHKGALVAAAGFTAAAKTRATKAGIDLYRLIDAESHEWQTLVSIPVLVDDRSIGAFNAQLFGDLAGITKEQVADFGNLELYQAGGRPLGKIGDLVNQKWNRGEISHEPGRHAIQLGDGDTYVTSGGSFHRLTVVANVDVIRTLYFGHLPLTEIKGLHNEVTGLTATRRIQTDWLDHDVVQRTWQQLSSLDELAVQPVLTFDVSSHYDERPPSVAT